MKSCNPHVFILALLIYEQMNRGQNYFDLDLETCTSFYEKIFGAFGDVNLFNKFDKKLLNIDPIAKKFSLGNFLKRIVDLYSLEKASVSASNFFVKTLERTFVFPVIKRLSMDRDYIQGLYDKINSEEIKNGLKAYQPQLEDHQQPSQIYILNIQRTVKAEAARQNAWSFFNQNVLAKGAIQPISAADLAAKKSANTLKRNIMLKILNTNSYDLSTDNLMTNKLRHILSEEEEFEKPLPKFELFLDESKIESLVAGFKDRESTCLAMINILNQNQDIDIECFLNACLYLKQAYNWYKNQTFEPSAAQNLNTCIYAEEIKSKIQAKHLQDIKGQADLTAMALNYLFTKGVDLFLFERLKHEASLEKLSFKPTLNFHNFDYDSFTKSLTKKR